MTPQILSCQPGARLLPLQPLLQKVPFSVLEQITSAVGSLIERFLSQGMIDFHLNENREAIMHRMNETKALLVFSQSSPTLYLIREILSLPPTPSVCLPVCEALI